MSKEWAKPFYNSKAWRDCRDKYFAARFGLCERCGGAGLIVHHKVELTPANVWTVEISLNWELLELLCLDCHNAEHGVFTIPEPSGFTFDEHGDITPR